MIVVTGGAGFIGSCILARLNAMGHEDIIVVDHLSDSSKKENLKGKKYVSYVDKEDFLKDVIAEKVDPSIDCVIHMGACSSTILSDEEYYERNNFEYTRDLAKWALSRGVRFIYASSAATYGSGENGYKDDEKTIRECNPLNFYGESKKKFDEWVFDNDASDKVVGLKFFNVFGPNEYHKGEMRSVLNKAYDCVTREGKMVLFKSHKSEYADGEQKRDFIYIKDAVDITIFFFENPQINGIFNVGTGKARTWNDLAYALFDAVGKMPDITYIDMPDEIKSQYQYFTEADMTKLRAIGYKKSFIELEDSVKDYVGYLKNHSYI